MHLSGLYQQQLDEASFDDASASSEPDCGASSRARVVKVAARKTCFEFGLIGTRKAKPVRTETLTDQIVFCGKEKKY